MNINTWIKVAPYILGVLAVSIILSILFWEWFGIYNSPILSGNLDINYFNTVCGIFTIIGLWLALYQISELKKQEEIIRETEDKTQENLFKKEHIYTFGVYKSDLILLQNDISNITYLGEEEVNNFIVMMNGVVNGMKYVMNKQKSILKDREVIDCKKSVTLLEDLIRECDEVNLKKTYNSFKKNHFRTTIGSIIEHISICENNLKK